MELYWAAGHQVYVTPVRHDVVCVAVLSRNPGLQLDRALESFPELAAHLQSSAVTSAERGGVTSTRKLKAVYRDRVALIGDASGSVDAITGQGLCWLFARLRRWRRLSHRAMEPVISGNTGGLGGGQNTWQTC